MGADGTAEVTSMAYSVDATGWQGLLEVTAVNGRPEHEAAASDPTVDGMVALRGQHTCAVVPVARFTVDGLLTVVW